MSEMTQVAELFPIWKTRTYMYLYYTANDMDADVLATSGARASAAMVLAQFVPNIPVSAPKGLTDLTHCGLEILTASFTQKNNYGQLRIK